MLLSIGKALIINNGIINFCMYTMDRNNMEIYEIEKIAEHSLLDLKELTQKIINYNGHIEKHKQLGSCIAFYTKEELLKFIYEYLQPTVSSIENNDYMNF